MTREPFPLQWPDGWPRTASHERTMSRFVTGMSRALKELLAELDRLGAADVVITSNLPRRSNGMPYGDAEDSGVAVWFILGGEERVLACDRWERACENIHAIALTVAAFRGIDRWGVRDVVSRAFQGFKALPPAADAARPWWVVLAIVRDPLESPLATLAKAKRAHRMLIRSGHPDKPEGDHERAVELNNAIAQAEAELTRPAGSAP